MDLSPLTYQETFQLIQELNAFADEADGVILQAQQQYESRKAGLLADNARRRSDFDSDCAAAVAAVQSKSQRLISDAVRIQSDMRSIDERLISIDKYYVKTKTKKEAELAGVKDAHYDSNGDYFVTLNQIKKDYTVLNRKYSEDILPSLLNGLNYLFSNKRKRDYEELIILLNTVEAFVKEISSVMPELTRDVVADMESTQGGQRADLTASQDAAMARLNDQYSQIMNDIAAKIDAKLDAMLPNELVDYTADLVSRYTASYGKVNSKSFVANGMLTLGFVDFPIAAFVQSRTLASFINEKCKKLMAGGSIKFPLFCSTASSLPLYIKKDGTNSEAVKQLVHGVMFSFLSSALVSKLRLSVIDCENHGNSVEPYFDAKKKMPELFDERFYVAYDEANAKIRALNEEVERISQDVLGTQYSSIYGYAKGNPQSDCSIELLTIFDFPKGLDEYSLSALGNIIVHGPRCGIYVTITESSELSTEVYSKEFINNIAKIRKTCVIVQQDNAAFSVMGLPFLHYNMPARNDFNAFFSKYMLINEGIRNRGIVFPSLIKNLVDSRDEREIAQNIKAVQDVIDKYNTDYGHVPDANASYPDQVMVGLTQYPPDIFADSFGFKQINANFSTQNGRVLLPLSLDLNQSANLMCTYDESKSASVAALTHHIIWSFLSSLPVAKTNVVLFDAEKKGGNAVPFLDFKKCCPDVFDGTIYSNADDICERLNKLNRNIDNLIQDKLGNRFANLLEYNRSAPNRAEAITVLVIYDFPSGFDSRSLNMLQSILKNGGKCGVYTLICHNRDIRYSSYDSVDEHIEACKRYCTQIEAADGGFMLLPFNLPVTAKTPLSSAAIDSFIGAYKKTSDKIKNKGLSFTDILDKDLFSRDLSDGLSIPVGVGDGESIVPVVFGVGSSHHALVAGATGSGKSTLLHTLIMSAMLHYSPDLLHLYLMDFKSGTEFKVYDGKRLPHIKLLALDAMQEFGESILENLVAEMGKRSEKFKTVGASKLGEYVKLSGEPMPKILVIMDEFQVLFNDSSNRKVAYNCAELTKRIVTEGRSFGIHLLMATQSTKIISDLTLATGTIEQMRIRIGLKCGEWDANYLFTDRNNIKALEMMKGPIGTAVMNLEYTESDLIGFRAAYCDDASQEKYLNLIEERLAGYPYDLQTFEGGRTVELLETEYGASGLQSATPLSIEVGTLIKVAPPMNITFDRRRKHNTLICGSSERMSENLANIYTLAILKNHLSSLYCIDGERLIGSFASDSYYTEYSRFGPRFTIADSRADIIRCIRDVYDSYTERKKSSSTDPIYIVIKNLQFLDIVKTMLKGEPIDETDYIDSDLPQDAAADSFDFGISFDAPTLNVSDKLLKLIDDGTAYGIHVIVSSLEFQSVKECMYFGENILSKFPERYVFALNDNDSESLIENISVASLRDNTVYYSDSIKCTFQLKPYVFPTPDALRRHLDRILAGGDS